MATTINADNGAVSGSAGLKSSSDGTGVLALQTNGTTAVTVDASQNVGIGTASPGAKLDVAGNAIISVTDNTNAALRITQLGTGNALLVEDSTNPDATPFVITAEGRIVLGATSLYPSPNNTNFTDKFQLNGATTYDSSADFISWATGTDTGANLNLARSDSGTIGTHTVVGSADIFGNVRFFGSDGTNFIEGAKISAGADGTPGTNDMPGRLVFSTTADGASTPTERMRIDSSGNVGIGESASIVRKLCITASGTTATTRAGIQLKNEVGTTAEIYQGPTSNNALIFEENGSERMRIDTSGNLLFNSGYGSVATAYGCRAWVNFNGTGTVAIRASGNVSSITDNGTGDYTVNFTTAMPDVNYSIVGSTGSGNTYGSYDFNNPGAGSRFAVGSCRINAYISQSAGLSDVDTVCIAVFR
jgi:uncharacterized protein (AIM24 family)